MPECYSMPDSFPISAILVPQGAEYRSVCQGIRRCAAPSPIVIPLPIGPSAVHHFLKAQSDAEWTRFPLLVMGLCGSLAPRYCVGDAVLYQQCLDLSGHESANQPCDRDFTAWLQTRLHLPVVPALTSDRIITSAQEKQQLAQIHRADVVDMEGNAILTALPHARLAMLRVVSDDCHHDLPDLTPALSPAGELLPGKLAIALLRRPIAATRLIRGSLHGLKVLQTLTATLLSSKS